MFYTVHSELAAKAASLIQQIQIIKSVIQDKILHRGHKE